MGAYPSLNCSKIEVENWFLKARAIASALDMCLMEISKTDDVNYENALILSGILNEMFGKEMNEDA